MTCIQNTYLPRTRQEALKEVRRLLPTTFDKIQVINEDIPTTEELDKLCAEVEGEKHG